MSHLQNQGSALPEGGQPKHLPRRMEGAQEPLSRRRPVRQWILAGGRKADPPETACKRHRDHLGHTVQPTVESRAPQEGKPF